MEFESATLTLVSTNEHGEKVQTVFVVTEADLSDVYDCDIQELLIKCYFFRKGIIDKKPPPKKEPPLDKGCHTIPQSEKLRLFYEQEALTRFDFIEIE